MCCGGRVAVAERSLRISTTFRRSVERTGVKAGSPGYRAVSAAMRALASGNLPAPATSKRLSHRAHVRECS
jgi:hypothetical protein